MKTIYFPGTGDIQAIQFTKGELLSQPCDYTVSLADLLIAIKNPNAAEFKYCSYYEIDGELGVSTKDKSMAVARVNRDQFELLLQPGCDASLLFGREELAEFLKLAGMFIDPDDKWMPKGEIVCSDY